MKPTGPIPPYFSANSDGQLLIGGVAAEEIVAEAGGTPVFAYDNNIVGGQIAQLRAKSGVPPASATSSSAATPPTSS
jgi:diaminopimelate decarboxylase